MPVPRRLTRSLHNDRQAVWQDRPRALYFLRDSREVWRLAFDDDGVPAADAAPWLVPPIRQRATADSLDMSPSGDRLLVGLQAVASDIWLVELK